MLFDGVLGRHFEELPLIAILRGVIPKQVVEIGEVLVEAGFRIIEIPLNSESAFESIQLLKASIGKEATVGAGTIVSVEQIDKLRDLGGALVVMPHADPKLIEAAVALQIPCLAGVATPGEAFAALESGASGLKLFPAEILSPLVVKSWRAILPAEIPMIPVGSITPDKLAPYLNAGANGFGLGSALFQPTLSAVEVSRRAEQFVSTWLALE